MLIDPLVSPNRGSYLLWYYLPRATLLNVGRLGRQSFVRGWYGYCGSAMGPGGLRARLRHHLSPPSRHHWHIDYFKSSACLREIWLCEGDNREHDLSFKLTELGAQVPVAGFGSSDCRCISHLVRLPSYSLVRQISRKAAFETGFRRLAGSVVRSRSASCVKGIINERAFPVD